MASARPLNALSICISLLSLFYFVIRAVTDEVSNGGQMPQYYPNPPPGPVIQAMGYDSLSLLTPPDNLMICLNRLGLGNRRYEYVLAI